MNFSPSVVVRASAAFDDIWGALPIGARSRYIARAELVWTLLRLMETDVLRVLNESTVFRFHAQAVLINRDTLTCDNLCRKLGAVQKIEINPNEKGYEVIVYAR